MVYPAPNLDDQIRGAVRVERRGAWGGGGNCACPSGRYPYISAEKLVMRASSKYSALIMGNAYLGTRSSPSKRAELRTRVHFGGLRFGWDQSRGVQTFICIRGVQSGLKESAMKMGEKYWNLLGKYRRAPNARYFTKASELVRLPVFFRFLYRRR